MRRLPALAAALALASCATVPAPTGLTPGAHYVALGSSYAAGAGIPPLATDRPARCGASQLSYSRLLATRLGLTLTDASCGGATTAHVLGAWDELPAQIDAVTPDTRLVTITIGGNDLNYMGLMFAGSCHAGVSMERAMDPATGQCRAVPIPDAAAYLSVEQSLTQVLRAIRAHAPQARIVLVQYLALASDDNCAAAPLLDWHYAAARNLARGLAQASERAAQRAGAEVLAMDQISLGHTACDPEPWTHGYYAGYDASQGAPWHPTAAGHAAIAEELVELLGG